MANCWELIPDGVYKKLDAAALRTAQGKRGKFARATNDDFIQVIQANINKVDAAIAKLTAPGQAAALAPAPEVTVEPITTRLLTDREKAAEAWDNVALTVDGAPTFDQLSEERQDTWVGYGEANWSAADVMHEMKAVDAESSPRAQARAGAQMSKAPATVASQAAQVLSEIKSMMRIGALSSRVSVVQSVKDLPVGVQQSVNPDALTQGFVYQGKAYLVADNIAPGKARSVFLHEVGAHLGLENLLGKAQYAALVAKVKQWASKNDGSLESRVAKAATQRVKDAETAANQSDSELVAYFIEEAVDAGVNPTAMDAKTEIGRWLQRVWAALKQAVVKLGLNPDKLTARDVVDMAYGAAHIEAASGAASKVGEVLGRGVQHSIAAKISQKLLSWVKQIRDRNPVPNALISPVAPPVYHMLGFTRPIAIDIEHARHIFNTHPEITAEDIAAIPDLLTRPRVVMNYKDGLRVILDARDGKGNPLVVGLTPDKWTEGGKVLKVTEVSTLFGADGSASMVVRAAWDNEIRYMKKEEVARIQALQSVASIATKEGKAPHDNPGNDLRKTIVLSDEALAKFVAGDKQWETYTTPVNISAAAQKTLAGVQFSKAKPVTMKSVVDDVPGALASAWDSFKYGRDKIATRAMFTTDLVNVASKVLPSAAKYMGAMSKINVERGKAERLVEGVLADFRALPNAEQGTGPASVNGFLKESTSSGKWMFIPDWLPKGSVEVDKELAAQFESTLSEKGREVVKSVMRHGYNTLQAMQEAAIESSKSEYDALIAEATKAGDTAEVDKLTKEKAKSLKDFQSLLAIHGFKPYAPLKRFGNYVVLAVSSAYKAAHEAGDIKAMQDMQLDGKHYRVEFAETRRHAKSIAQDLEKDFPDGYVGQMEKQDDNLAMGGRDMLGAFGRLRRAMKESTDEALGVDKETGKRIDDMMRQLYLTMLSEASARKSEVHRRNIAGADNDMMRSFAVQGRATAHFIASLKTSGEVQDHLDTMRKDTRKLDNGREERQLYYNEIVRRHSMGLEYRPSPIVDKMLSGTSGMMLLTNPAYHLMNALQPLLMTQPLLAARHGYARSLGELKRAYMDLAPILKTAKFDEDSYAKLPTDVRQAISDLADRGVIDIMMDADLGKFESASDGHMQHLTTVTEKLRHVAQNVESMNRLSSAIAAYRLEIGKPGADHQSALNYAAKIIYDTHGDYSGFNAPRFMRTPVGRVVTQFRKFQLIQLSLMVREFHRAFLNSSPEERIVGRKALAYTMAHMLAVGGTMGLPGFAAIAWAVGMAIPGDDEPDDPEATLRRLIGNKELADLMLKGAPKLAGVDMGRTAAGNMLSLFPYTDFSMDRKGYTKALEAATGPFFGGLLPRMYDGIGQMASGNVMKGTEALLPKGLANLMSAYRISGDGITQRNGDTVMSKDDIGALDIVSQAFGLPTNTLTDRTFLANSKYKAETFYKDKSSDLMQSYAKAAKANDAQEMRDIREEWTRVQEASKNMGLKPHPLQSLLKAPAEQAKREASARYGVEHKKGTQEFSAMLR